MEDGSRLVVYSAAVAVTQNSLDALIEMAGYGISYWASEAEIDDEAHTYTITDSEEGTVSVLTYTQLANALVKVALDPSVQVNSEIRGYAMAWYEQEVAGDEFAGGEIDADLADVVIQIAIYGEIIYG